VDRIGISVDTFKASPTGEFVRGWAYVVSEDGRKVTDWCGETLGGLSVAEGMSEIRKALYDFVSDARVAKVLHKGSQIGEIVEAVIIDDEFAASIGATTKRRGAWVGMRVHDVNVRKRILSGELKAFSVGGRGTRIPIPTEGAAR
jgi:putative serine protease XkdF